MNSKKQLIFLSFFLVSCFFFLSANIAQSKVINILSPLNYLDFQNIQEIKDITKFDINIEFVASKRDYLYKIKNGYGKYDIIIANSDVIKNLHDVYDMKKLDSFEKTQKHYDSRENTPYLKTLSFIPYGLISKVDLDKKNTSWTVFTDRKRYPKFRQQIFLPKLRSNFYLAMASFANNIVPPHVDTNFDNDLKKWLVQLKGQLIASNDSLLKLLEKNSLLLTADFLDKFLVLKKEMQSLNFIIPKEGTLYKDISIAILASSKNQKEAMTLLKLLFNNAFDLNEKLNYLPNSKQKLIPKTWISVNSLMNPSKKLERQINRIINH